jgi:Flp pilus assembly protein TadD
LGRALLSGSGTSPTALIGTATDVIHAIGQLWLLALVLAAAVLAFVFRHELRGVLGRLTRAELKLPKAGTIAFEAPASSVTDGDVAAEPTLDETSGEVNAPVTDESSFFVMFDAFLHGRVAEGQRAYESMQSGETDETERLRNEAVYLYLIHRHAADVNAETKLKTLTGNPAVAQAAWEWLATLHSSDGNYDEASSDWRQAASLASEPAERSRCLGRAYIALHEAGRFDEAIAQVEGDLTKTDDEAARLELMKAMAEIYGDRDPVMHSVSLELATELAPNDPKLHFDAAYALSSEEAVPSQLALLHYKLLLALHPRHPSALNNAGVQYELLKMRTLSVACYQEAAELGETLAMSNLASRYLSSGFADDAQQLLDQARVAKNPHPNVGRGLASLADLRQGDSRAEDSVLQSARSEQKILRDFGREYYGPADGPVNVAGEWATESGKVLSLEQESARLAGNWRGTDISLNGDVRNCGIRLRSSEGGHALGVIAVDGTSLELVAVKDRKMSVVTLRPSNS